MITKQPTIEDIYNFDSYINTPGVRQGLLERAGDGDPELTLEDTDDGQAVYFNTPHGEIFPVGRPIQLAMGGNAAGRNSDRPISDVPMALFDMGAGAARGAVAQATGVFGDIEKLGRGLRSVFNRPEDQTRIDAFLKGMEEQTVMPTTERMGEILPPVVPPNAPDAKMRQGSANYGQTFGEFAPLPGGVEAATAGIKAGAKAAKALAPTAAEMVIKATEKTGMPVRGLNIVEDGPSLGKVVTPDQVETPNFKNWFGDWQASPDTASKVVDDSGAPLAVYHGTARPDRVGTNFKKSRATSGPMSFFTDDPEIASGYAKGKQDTSLAYEETDYANWFKKKDGRSTVNLDQAGARMSQQERQSVIEKLRDINMTDDGEIVYQPGGGTIMSDSSFDFYLQREANGNPLKLAKQLWLESGTLYDQEENFAKVLQLAGVKGFDADFPNASYPFVYKVFLDIKNPLDTSAIPESVMADLESTASRIRKKAASGGADMWDKNTIPPKEWIARLKADQADGTTHTWTSIPDWVTELLKAAGYDGIKDTGGKSIGHKNHTVWIPFEETQVKSAIGNRGTFDPTKKNILHGVGAGSAGTGATIGDKEQNQ